MRYICPVLRLVFISFLLCLAQTAYPQVDTSAAAQADTSTTQADTQTIRRPDTSAAVQPEAPAATPPVLPEAEGADTGELPQPETLETPQPETRVTPLPEPARTPPARPRRTYYSRAKPLYINTDTVLNGPAPTDTSKNAVNGFLQDFYSNYNSPRKQLEIPATPLQDHVIPDLDFQVREVRPAWHLLIPAAISILIAVLARFFRKDLRDMFEGFISNRLINQTTREPGMLNTPMAFMLLILGSLSLGALLYFIIPSDRLSFPYQGPELFLFFSGLVMLVYLMRVFLLKITGFIFDLREFVNSYLYILYTTTGTICFPILIILLIRLLAPPELAGASIPALQIIFLLFFVYQYTRGVWYLVYTFQFPRIYLILYLCAFEICPLLILGMGLFNR